MKKLTSNSITGNLKKQHYIIRRIFKDHKPKIKCDKEDNDFTLTFSGSLGLYETRRLTFLCDNFGFNFSIGKDRIVLIWHSQTLTEIFMR